MEFKGTKGKWLVDKKYGCVYSDGKNIIGNVICESPDLDCEESLKNWIPNAKLISKAPKMAENIQQHLDVIELNDMEFYYKHGFGKKELIHRSKMLLLKATTI